MFDEKKFVTSFRFVPHLLDKLAEEVLNQFLPFFLLQLWQQVGQRSDDPIDRSLSNKIKEN
jgi:hypothetical protein